MYFQNVRTKLLFSRSMKFVTSILNQFEIIIFGLKNQLGSLVLPYFLGPVYIILFSYENGIEIFSYENGIV